MGNILWPWREVVYMLGQVFLMRNLRVGSLFLNRAKWRAQVSYCSAFGEWATAHGSRLKMCAIGVRRSHFTHIMLLQHRETQGTEPAATVTRAFGLLFLNHCYVVIFTL